MNGLFPRGLEWLRSHTLPLAEHAAIHTEAHVREGQRGGSPESCPSRTRASQPDCLRSSCLQRVGGLEFCRLERPDERSNDGEPGNCGEPSDCGVRNRDRTGPGLDRGDSGECNTSDAPRIGSKRVGFQPERRPLPTRAISRMVPWRRRGRT